MNDPTKVTATIAKTDAIASVRRRTPRRRSPRRATRTDSTKEPTTSAAAVVAEAVCAPPVRIGRRELRSDPDEHQGGDDRDRGKRRDDVGHGLREAANDHGQ